MSIVLRFWVYLFWITLAPHRKNGLAHIISGVLDMSLLLMTWGIRRLQHLFPSPDLRALLSQLLFHYLFFGFTCTFSFAHTCPHRASGINLAELKIINPVVEEGAPLTCAEAHFLTPSLRCILRVRGLPRRFIFITTPPCISVACVCQGASGEAQIKLHF